jgi:hypothetical protein
MDAMIRFYKVNYFLSLHAAAIAFGSLTVIRYSEQRYSPALFLGILATLMLLALIVCWLKVLFPANKSNGLVAQHWIDD